MNIMSLIDAGQDSQALSDYDTLLAAYGGHANIDSAIFCIGEAYYNRAVQHESNKDPESEAIADFTRAVSVLQVIFEQLPHTGLTNYAYYLTADSSKEIGRYEEAAGYYENAIEYYEDAVESYAEVSDVQNFEYAWNAQFMTGRIYEKLVKSGSMSESEADPLIRTAYETLLEKYPNCKAAKTASNWLNNHNSK